MSWLDAIGWLGSALLVYSVMQARVLRFRVLNLAACIVLAGFNAALEIWPMVAMNLALCAINLWHIRGLVTTRDDEATYSVLEVGPQDDYLRHVLRVHAEDILKFQPDLVWDGAAEGAAAFLVLRGDETVGVVLVREHDRVGQVVLDYVTPRFRDFSPGKFVWRQSRALRDKGYTEIRTPATMVNPYYERLGFRPGGGGSWVLDLEASG